MKKTTLLTLLLISSNTIFTACSSKNIEKKSQVELFKIEQEKIAKLPMAKTYPINQNITYSDSIPQYEIQHIQVIDDYSEKKTFQPQPQYLAYTNYRNNLYNITRQIEKNSKKLLGKKYVWGATGPYTYDCSGFTQKVYRDAGINIPRVSREQARVGKYVNYNQLRKGDMVFFDTKKKRTGRVTHVGIYLGGGNFIHASSSAKKIVIFNFNEKDFYRKRFLWGRRVIQDNTRMASL